MKWLKSISKKRKKKVLVLGLDGVPYTFVDRVTKQGMMPNLAKLITEGSFKRMNSAIPTVSSVAWSSYMTGKNPGKHNIYGFVDHFPKSRDIYIPTSVNMSSETLWEILSKEGKRVVVINVPVTYPPKEVNGILISCFLCTNIDKIAYPKEISQKLKEMGYRIDVDAWQARESKDKLLEDLDYTLKKRKEAALHFMENEDWDFFQLHIMGTDRINHFLWEQMENNDPKYAPAFYNYYKNIDQMVGEISQRADKNTTLIVLSDHGFCTLKKEVFLNFYLAEKGWLKFKKDVPESLKDIHSDSKAYSLIPGRIYVNLKGREAEGSVEPSDYEKIRKQIAEDLLKLKDPETQEKIIKEVKMREELYWNRDKASDTLNSAPDLVAIPYDGYDLKGNLNKQKLTEKGAIVGMHTYDDAFLLIKGENIKKDNIEIIDVMPTILKLLEIKTPDDVDGNTLI